MLLKKLLPNLYVSSIYQIDLQALKQKGIKGIITDLDNTLIEWDRPDATPELLEWLKQLREEGFKVIVVSNNNQPRVSSFAEPLGIPYISRAKKPSRASFHKAMNILGVSANQIVMIGDQMLTDILGGNRLGLYTILVSPVAQTDGFFTKINRGIERIALARLRKKGLITWEEK
ncbi:hypothetical protein BEP19_05955 [Ammoniphilus oxalaticus]|uniref:HAD family hydrolase n=1 Tax=Ammoniphilus oxalaticus TaxID=66863 RepID=A0A419SIY0_9BACL|nr:YqeG family HAD IIIA-type phosphatase [Ammoniphilus oxalaticus]RKD23963.1 hypothetical protein BEP19_05955 [Ammoniphilus oxalaticus]